jgi:hypothetical protein
MIDQIDLEYYECAVRIFDADSSFLSIPKTSLNMFHWISFISHDIVFYEVQDVFRYAILRAKWYPPEVKPPR